MELINSNRQEKGLVVANQDPRAVAIRERYGDLASFTSRYSPAKQRQCYHNVAKAVEAGAPTFCAIKRAYGDQAITAFVKTHVAEAIIRMGEDRDVDPADVQFIAEAIIDSERTQTLTLASVLGFFYRLKCGEFDIYGKVTPRKVLEAFRKYATDQQAKENRIAFEQEQRLKAKEDERHRRESVSWEEFAERNGIDPEGGMAGYIARQAAEYREKKHLEELRKQPPGKLIAEVITSLTSVISFVVEYCRIKNIPLWRK